MNNIDDNMTFEEQFIKKYRRESSDDKFPKRISDPILCDDIVNFFLNYLKELEEECVGEEKRKDWSKDEHSKTCKDGCTYCSYAEGQIVGENLKRKEIKQIFSKRR